MIQTYSGRGLLFMVILLIIFSAGCSRLSIKDTITDSQFTLINQYGEEVVFPDDFLGKTMIAGYIYTSCPDVCPFITYNMRDVQRAFDQSEIQLISFSFDPDRDTPERLAEYAHNYRLSLDNWTLLTGSRSEVEGAMKRLGIRVIKNPTRFLDDNTPFYFMDHTDRISLVDRDGNLRMNYFGSESKPEQIIEDIKNLHSN